MTRDEELAKWKADFAFWNERADRETAIKEARELGEEHGKSAATWATDGNGDPAGYARTLQKLSEGEDPEACNLPNEPNLSGEWADDLTPVSLFEEVVGRAPVLDGLDVESKDGGLIDALCDAYETGVSEVFVLACEEELAKAAPAPIGDQFNSRNRDGQRRDE